MLIGDVEMCNTILLIYITYLYNFMIKYKFILNYQSLMGKQEHRNIVSENTFKIPK